MSVRSLVDQDQSIQTSIIILLDLNKHKSSEESNNKGISNNDNRSVAKRGVRAVKEGESYYI